MSVDTAPLLSRFRRFGAKIEASTGTAIAIAAADATTPVLTDASQPIITYDVEQIERPNEGSLSNRPMQFGARSGTGKFRHEVYGSGTTGDPSWAKYLLGAGMVANSSVYTPVTGATATMTMSSFLAGGAITKTIAGAMGTGVLTATRGKPAMIEWTFTGKYVAQASATLTSPTSDTIIAPRVAGATFTVGGVKYFVPEVVIDFGNTVILREDITDETGYHSAYITARKPTVKFSPEAVAGKDWYADHLAGATAALVLNIGAVAGNQINFSFPKLQLINPPTEGDRNGMMTQDLEFMACENTDAGNDEYSIEFVPAA